MESSSWLDGCFVDCLKEAFCLQSVKESFIMRGFSLVRLINLRERFVLLSCDDDGIIGKLIDDNKEWFDGMSTSDFPWDGSFAVKKRCA